jgi:hypothetical protein
MVLGIISIAGIAFCAAAGVVCGIIAIVMGVKARNAIRMEPYSYSGDGYAKAGIIMGAIGITICALYVIVIIVFYLFMFLMIGTM